MNRSILTALLRLSRLALSSGFLFATAAAAQSEPHPASPAATAATESKPPSDWQTLGLMRIRDLTPFGIARLDMLPAHAVPATPGTYAFEVNLSYQNTWALSENVRRYLAERGVRRGEIGADDVEGILALPGDAYLFDGEVGLLDLTLHYRASRHIGLYATIPYFNADGGFLDSTIESFHENVGLSNAGREFVPRNRFLAVAGLNKTTIVIDDEPESEFGDPVFGVRYSLRPSVGRYDVVLEAAAKLVLDKSGRLVSTGRNDYGAQLSLQRFFRRNALYLSLAAVYYRSPDPGLSRDTWIPTVVAGWETRIAKHTNFILQAYASRSAVQETTLDELSADKLQATIGLQWLYRGNVVRLGITENVANFDNTPDIGVNLSIARIVFGSKGNLRGDRP